MQRPNEMSVQCPICKKSVSEERINQHLDSNCRDTPKEQGQSFFTPTRTGPSVPLASRPTKSNGKRRSPSPGAAVRPPPAAKKHKVSTALKEARPLAERVRPSTLESFVGQLELVGPNGPLRVLLEADKCPSMILWGPSGTGKTTLARIIAQMTSSRFVEMSATAVGVQECRKLFDEAKNQLLLTGQRTILFLDEIHRFAKNQQDLFLPYVESGQICLIGATTENPSFKVNNALLSRCRVFVLKKLATEEVLAILKAALGDHSIDDTMMLYLAQVSDGDARIALNILEVAMELSTHPSLSNEDVKAALRKTHFAYDTHGDAHYDSISALHKSLRGSDPDASLFYVTRMLESGEDPLYIARRMVRFASEDIGTADSASLLLATATYTAVQQIGIPEADVILAHCAVALAEAPKSVRVYSGMNRVKKLLREDPLAAGANIPIHLRNAPTKLMKELGYGKEYKYNPQYISGRVKQTYLPDTLVGTKFLDVPDERGRDPELSDSEEEVFVEPY